MRAIDTAMSTTSDGGYRLVRHVWQYLLAAFALAHGIYDDAGSEQDSGDHDSHQPAAHTRNTVYTKPTVPNTRAFFTCSGVRCSRFQAIFM